MTLTKKVERSSDERHKEHIGIQDILTLIEVFVNQKSENIFERSVKMATCDLWMQNIHKRANGKLDILLLHCCHLYHVFTYIHLLLIEKDLTECRNVSFSM